MTTFRRWLPQRRGPVLLAIGICVASGLLVAHEGWHLRAPGTMDVSQGPTVRKAINGNAVQSLGRVGAEGSARALSAASEKGPLLDFAISGLDVAQENAALVQLRRIRPTTPRMATLSWIYTQGRSDDAYGRVAGYAVTTAQAQSIIDAWLAVSTLDDLPKQESTASLMPENADKSQWTISVIPENSHVVILDIGADGSFGLLYPRRDRGDSIELMPGASVVLRDLTVTPPYGLDRVLVIDTPELPDAWLDALEAIDSSQTAPQIVTLVSEWKQRTPGLRLSETQFESELPAQ